MLLKGMAPDYKVSILKLLDVGLIKSRDCNGSLVHCGQKLKKVCAQYKFHLSMEPRTNEHYSKVWESACDNVKAFKKSRCV